MYLRNYLFVVHLIFLDTLSNKSCSPSSAMFARVGDIMPPCGVPSSVGKSSPLNTYPHSSHLRSISLSIGILLINHAWLIWSKHPLMSPSRIHSGATNEKERCSIARWHHVYSDVCGIRRNGCRQWFPLSGQVPLGTMPASHGLSSLVFRVGVISRSSF